MRNARVVIYSSSAKSVYCFVCNLFGSKQCSHFLQEKGSVTGEIDHHEKITTHRDSVLTYLTHTRLRVGATVEKTNSGRV